MSCRLEASLQKKFGPILKFQETLPTLGAWLRMRFPPYLGCAKFVRL